MEIQVIRKYRPLGWSGAIPNFLGSGPKSRAVKNMAA